MSHKLVRVDKRGELRVAHCACGDAATVVDWPEAITWISLHRELPGLPPAALATILQERQRLAGVDTT